MNIHVKRHAMRLVPLVFTLLSGATANAQWLEVSNNDFTLTTDASEETARKMIRDFAVYRLALSKLAPMTRDVQVMPTTMIAVGARDWSAFAASPMIEGFFTVRPDRNYIVFDRTGGMNKVRVVLFHEYMHYLLHNGSRSAVPRWWDEGVAELFSTITDYDGKVEFGRFPKARTYAFYGTGMLPLESMLRATGNSPELRNPALASAFYGQAWLMAHYLLIGNPERGRQMEDYLQAVDAGVPVEQAVQRAFGVGMPALEKEFEAYARSNRIKGYLLDIGPLPDGKYIVAKALPDSVANARLALAARSLGRPMEASRRFLDRAAKADASHPLVQAAKAAQLVGEKGWGEEIRSLVREVLSSPAANHEATYAAALVMHAQIERELRPVSEPDEIRESGEGTDWTPTVDMSALFVESREPDDEQKARLRDVRDALAKVAGERDYQLGATMLISAIDPVLDTPPASTLEVLQAAAKRYPANPELAALEARALLAVDRPEQALVAITRGAEYSRDAAQRREFVAWMRELE